MRGPEGSCGPMKDVDWSSAPEGATHYRDEFPNFFKQTPEGLYQWAGGVWSYIGVTTDQFSFCSKLIFRHENRQSGEDGLSPVKAKTEGWDTASYLLQKLSEANLEIDQIKTDSERLEFLAESNAIVAQCYGSFYLYWPYDGASQGETYGSMRDAIDAEIINCRPQPGKMLGGGE